MKIATVAATAFLASSVSAGLFSTSAISTTDDFPVPGTNPLKHCQDPAEDILDVISVDLNPNPPTPYVKCFLTLLDGANLVTAAHP
jgi:hypothetical protein